jgi:hypothetical protein
MPFKKNTNKQNLSWGQDDYDYEATLRYMARCCLKKKKKQKKKPFNMTKLKKAKKKLL